MPQAIRTSFSRGLPALEVCHLDVILEHYWTNFVLEIGLFLEILECSDEFSMFFLGHIRGVIESVSDFRSRSSRAAICRRVHQVYLPVP